MNTPTPKSPLRSKTILGVLLLFAASVFDLAAPQTVPSAPSVTQGVIVPDVQTLPADGPEGIAETGLRKPESSFGLLADLVLAVAQLAGAVLAIWGRLDAKAPIKMPSWLQALVDAVSGPPDLEALSKERLEELMAKAKAAGDHPLAESIRRQLTRRVRSQNAGDY